MISRKSTQALASLLTSLLRRHQGGANPYWMKWDDVYEFFFERDYPDYLCNLVYYGVQNEGDSCQAFRRIIQRLHTGEELRDALRDKTPEERTEIGQGFLVRLCEDVADSFGCGKPHPDQIEAALLENLHKRLELDGFSWHDNKLFKSESDLLDVEQETGILAELYGSMELDNQQPTFDYLSNSEEYFAGSKWKDSINNSRLFFEAVQQESAATLSKKVLSKELAAAKYESAKEVRKFLKDNELITDKEVQVLARVYGLLSDAGPHPKMADSDQARLLRQLSMTLSQFVLLRLEGALRQN